MTTDHASSALYAIAEPARDSSRGAPLPQSVSFPGPWHFSPGQHDAAWPQPAALPPVELKGAPGLARRLANKQVLIIGLGAVNGHLLQRLAQSGVSRLIGADPDRYELASCWTQPCSSADVGRSKAAVQARRAAECGAPSGILTASIAGQDLPYQLLWDSDVWVVSADNLEAVVWAGNLAAAMGKPLFQGAVFGEQWLSIVRHWDLRQSNNPCPACQLSQQEWRQQQSRHGCDPALARQLGSEPTRALPSVCATTADMLSSKVLSYLLDRIPAFPAAEEWIYAGGSHRMLASAFDRNPHCRCPHEAWERVVLNTDPSRLTLESLARHLGGDALAALGTSQLMVKSEWPWARQAIDDRGNWMEVQRFARPGASWHSGASQLTATPVGLRSCPSSTEVQSVRDVPLAELGLPSGAGVSLQFEDRQTWFFMGPLELRRDASLARKWPRESSAIAPESLPSSFNGKTDQDQP